MSGVLTSSDTAWQASAKPAERDVAGEVWPRAGRGGDTQLARNICRAALTLAFTANQLCKSLRTLLSRYVDIYNKKKVHVDVTFPWLWLSRRGLHGQFIHKTIGADPASAAAASVAPGASHQITAW